MALRRGDDTSTRGDRASLTGAAEAAAQAFDEFRAWLGEFDAPGWPVPSSDPEWGESPSRERVDASHEQQN